MVDRNPIYVVLLFQANDVEYLLTALRIHAAKKNPVVNARMSFNLRVQVKLFTVVFLAIIIVAFFAV